ncbi:MAG TPA: hypothetical protein VGC07_05935 [Granulicella sp.]
MSNIVIWSLGGILIVFCLGLISAIESRRQRGVKSKQDSSIEEIPVAKEYVRVSAGTRKNEAPKTAMSMAAGGIGNVSVGAFNGNAEENLASIGSHSR